MAEASEHANQTSSQSDEHAETRTQSSSESTPHLPPYVQTLLDSSESLLNDGLGIAHDAAELFRCEWQLAKKSVISGVLWAVLGIFAAFSAWLLLQVSVVAGLYALDVDWVWATLTVALLNILCALWAGGKLKHCLSDMTFPRIRSLFKR